MFDQLTKYLIRYKTLGIPEIGSIKLVQQPASLDVADKLIYPPVYYFEHRQEVSISRHQIYYFAGGDNASTAQQLEAFGGQIKNHIRKKPLGWKGIGVWEQHGDDSIVFTPEKRAIEGLQPLVATKVIRENVQHTVLIGEREVKKGGEEAAQQLPERTNRYAIITAWVLVILAIIFIAFYLFKEGFQATSSGTRLRAVPSNAAPPK